VCVRVRACVRVSISPHSAATKYASKRRRVESKGAGRGGSHALGGRGGGGEAGGGAGDTSECEVL
jgi:hypothetical protein